MSDDQQSSAGLGIGALLLALILIVVSLPVGIALLVTTTEPACGSLDGAGVDVDLSGLPKGPVAGYRGAQLRNAALIMLAGKKMGLGVRDQTIGVMTAMGESSLIVIDRGDAAGPDSRGLFQQRANGAWGSYHDRMDPTISATNFFKAMKKIDNRNRLTPTQVAHRTQRNADPNHYTKFWGGAVKVVEALSHTRSNLPPTATSQPRSGADRYHLGPVQPQTRWLANELGPRFGFTEIGGWREDAYDDHPSGLALDFMIHGDKARGDRLADYLTSHAQSLGVQYVIWKQHIWNLSRSGEGWRLMPDRGGITANHFDHVHVTMQKKRKPGHLDDAATLDATGACPADAASSGPVTAGGWARPAKGPVTSPFGMRWHPVKHVYKLHSGTDFGSPCGDPIYAAADGTVRVTHPPDYGTYIDIDHGGGIVSGYGHMFANTVTVHNGDHVKAGQLIAKVGTAGTSTGCHLHFEIKRNGTFTNPATWLTQHGVNLK